MRSKAQRLAEVAARAAEGFVVLELKESYGLGFVAAPGRLVSTLHVVGDEASITAHLSDGSRLDLGAVGGVDHRRDLAVLLSAQLAVAPLLAPPLRLAEEGTTAFTFTLSKDRTRTQWVDVRIAAIQVLSDLLTVYRLDGDLPADLSGAPLVSTRGEALGVLTQAQADDGPVVLAVPHRYLVPLLSSPEQRPLSALTLPRRARRRRMVPQHPVALLDGSSAKGLDHVASVLNGAINVGAPAYNRGDVATCWRLYSGDRRAAGARSPRLPRPDEGAARRPRARPGARRRRVAGVGAARCLRCAADVDREVLSRAGGGRTRRGTKVVEAAQLKAMRRVLIVLAVAAALAAACTTTDRYRGRQAPDGPVLTVLVPGYRGSFLYDDNRRVYLDPAAAFRPGSESLGTCSGGMKPLEPGGPMTKFTIWPYAFNVYDDFMEWGRTHTEGFTAYGYDWRADLKWNGEQLCEFIGQRRANVIAHSMGGLVTMLAIQKCPEKFRAVVFAGVPFRGAPGLFADLFLGASTYQNTALLSPEALWTFPATWQLLPRTDDFFVDEAGQQVALPISRAETWRDWKLPCPQRLQERLSDRAAMPVDFTQAPARSLAVIGRGLPTTVAMRVKEGFFDFKNPARDDGDGTIAAANATPPFPAQTANTTADHLHLLDDPKMRSAIEAFFQ
ncbi:MAG: hypothetical protein IPJ65_36655 [Archangiaceae bacterium]|nr:hypothetical protein [Archangiaceae bacterium]